MGTSYMQCGSVSLCRLMTTGMIHALVVSVPTFTQARVKLLETTFTVGIMTMDHGSRLTLTTVWQMARSTFTTCAAILRWTAYLLVPTLSTSVDKGRRYQLLMGRV